MAPHSTAGGRKRESEDDRMECQWSSRGQNRLGKGFTHSMVHLWAEKQFLQWVPTFRPANLSALQNLAPFVLVIA